MEIKKRFYEIDLMRFFAAFSVMLFHYTRNADQFPVISQITKYGYLGVHLFFIISGFVIFFSIQKANAIEFVISRAVRLYPAYWFCASLTFLIVLLLDPIHSHSLGVYLINLTMLQGFFNVGEIDSSYWSLGVELNFYLLIFFLIFFQQIKNSLHFLSLWLVVTFILTLWHVKYVHVFLIPEYSSFFMAGAIFYLIRKNGLCLYKALILTVCYFFSLFYTIKSLHSTSDFQNHNQLIAFLLISFFYILFLLISLNKIRVSANKFIVLLGDITYPLYLIHQKVGGILINKLKRYSNQYIALFFVIVLMMMISVFINKLIEKKISIFLRNLLQIFTMQIKKFSSASLYYLSWKLKNE